MFDELFGGMFDFNGDGHTDFFKEATGFAIIDEITKEAYEDDLEYDDNSSNQ